MNKAEYSKRYRERHPERVKESRARSRAKNQEWQNEWRAANPEKVKEYQRTSDLKRKYGLTPESWLALFEGQGGRCASCGDGEADKRGRWHVDHCHRTGRVRAILCHACNTALGNLYDSPYRVSALLDYIGKQVQIDMKCPGGDAQ